jgi:spermidine synthase/MFS family permease
MSTALAPTQASKTQFGWGVFWARQSTTQQSGVSGTWRLLIIAVAIASNAAVLICQQAAIRLLAPLIGSSIETWSAILGVFLLGIAIGNFIAGKLADRYSATNIVSLSLLLGAISVFAMPLIVEVLTGSSFFAALSLEMQIITASFAVCLLPGITLSLTTPPSIRSLVSTPKEAGAISGRVFAWGTFGSLVGNYATGFILLAMFGVSAIVLATWCTLLMMACLVYVTGKQTTPTLTALSSGESDSASLPIHTTKDPAFEAIVAQCGKSWYCSAVLIVVVCSFVSGALEGAAFRILAPLVGVSMFLSAGVVGVILTGMAIGNSLGGFIAARYGTVDALKKSLAVASFSTLAIVILWTFSLNYSLFDKLPMIPKVVAWSFTLFLVPALALGTITPQVIGLSVREVNRTGAITGRLYGYSTLGCIAGILVAAWFMIESVGAIRTSILCGIAPLLLILVLSRFEAVPLRKETWRMAAGLMVLGSFLVFYHKPPFDRESKYFALKVTDAEIENRKVKKFALDSLVHSCIDLNDPSYLFYPHEQIQSDLTRAAAAKARAAGRVPRVLVIGGGGYTYPRWVESQADLADVQIEVVEIDPAVTEIAHDKLGLSRTTRIISIHKDGRQFVKSAREASYDLVIQDAVNDLAVPYHLMTAEYSRLVKRLLHPDCLYLLTVIDSFESGRFLASALRTTETVFGSASIVLPSKPSPGTRNVFVIAGRNGDNHQNHECLFSEMELDSMRKSTYVFPPEDIATLLRTSESFSPLLTDDYAPVDILMSGQFLSQDTSR